MRKLVRLGLLLDEASDAEVDTSFDHNPPVSMRALATSRFHFTENVNEVVLQKSISAQIREFILHTSNGIGQVDGFVWQLEFAKRLHEHFL